MTYEKPTVETYGSVEHLTNVVESSPPPRFE
jgi:hypothetical protein